MTLLTRMVMSYINMLLNGVTTAAINVDNDGDEFYIIAYDGGEAFLYHADSDANSELINIKPLIPSTHKLELSLRKISHCLVLSRIKKLREVSASLFLSFSLI